MRKEICEYIEKSYGVSAESPFGKSPETLVFRHANNRKWFAIIMEVPRRTLGLEGAGNISIINTKCDFILINSFLTQKGFFPAYHMNKAHWISTALDKSVEDKLIKDLIDISYDLTGTKKKKQT